MCFKISNWVEYLSDRCRCSYINVLFMKISSVYNMLWKKLNVMAARVRLKMQCGKALPFVILVIVCCVDMVCGMFEHRHCNHRHPLVHEVSLICNFLETSNIIDSNLSYPNCFYFSCHRHTGTDLPSFSH